VNQTLRIVIISSCDPSDKFVIRAISDHTFPVAVIQPVWERPPGVRSRLDNLIRHPLTLPLKRLEQNFLAKITKRRLRAVAARLGARAQDELPCPVIRLPTWSINTERGLELLRNLAPDVVLVSSGPLLKAEILGLPKICSLNLHYGLAPWYRGEHALYWPLISGDVEHIGVTLHEIDAGIDTGRIVGRTALACGATDTEVSLSIKAALEFAEMVPACLQRIAATRRVDGRLQEKIPGKLIRYRDRRWWWELRNWLQQQLSHSSLVTQQKREWFFAGCEKDISGAKRP